jgi:hypothetical protein
MTSGEDAGMTAFVKGDACVFWCCKHSIFMRGTMRIRSDYILSLGRYDLWGAMVCASGNRCTFQAESPGAIAVSASISLAKRCWPGLI